MKFLTHRRAPFAAIALICAGLLGFGYYLQYYTGLEPCPLCIFQRVGFFAVAVTAFAAAVTGAHLPGAVAYSTTLAALSLTGASVAARQVWLQHLPADQVPECGPGLEFMLDVYPLGETIRKVLHGSGDCAKVDWTFLGLSIAEWSLLCFLGIAMLAVAVIIVRASRRPIRRRRRSRRRESAA